MSRKQPEDSVRDAQRPGQMGQTAQRISKWSTNLLVSAVVIAAGLAFGRQVLFWWGDPAEAPSAADVLGPEFVGDPRHPHAMAFGDFPFLLNRQSLNGGTADVLRALRAGCRKAAEEVDTIAHAAGPAERALLEQTANSKPIERQAGRWEIHQLEAPLPLVVAVAPVSTPNASEVRRRVVCWGLAMPLGASQPPDRGQWTLFTYRASDREPVVDRTLHPLPAGAQRTMSLSAADGAALVAFRGLGEPQQWREFFDQHFLVNHRAEVQQPWQQAGKLWHVRYVTPTQNRVDVQLSVEQDGNISGMLTLSSSTPEQVESLDK